MQAQAALQTCPKHMEDEIDTYCRTCAEALCHECVKEDHSQHQWMPIKKLAKELRTNAQRRQREVASQLDSVLNGQEEVYRYLDNDSERDKSKCMSVLENTRSEIHRTVDEIVDLRKGEINTFFDDKKRKRESVRQKLQEENRKMKAFLDQLENEATTLSKLDVIRLCDDISAALSGLSTICQWPDDSFDVLEYREGNVDRKAIEKMMGYSVVHKWKRTDVSLIPIKSYVFGNSKVNSICPISDARAWIRCDNLFRLVTLEEEQLSSADSKIPVYNFDVSRTGRITFCNDVDSCVSNISESGEIEVLYSTKPLIPLLISITHSGDHLVSLVEENSLRRNDKSRRLLRRVTRSGETIREYEHDREGTTSLFHKPTKSVEHHNGDICVLNKYLTDDNIYTGNVIGLTYDGTVRFRYEGANMKCVFNPFDISCDMMGNSLITDRGNRCIHLTDTQGRFVKFLRHDMTLKPYSIALRENKLWIGSDENGQVSLYDYKSG